MKCYKLSLILTVVLLTVMSAGAATQIQISTDNTTFTSITDILYSGSIGTESAIALGLVPGECYDVRAKDDNTTWTYSHICTELAGEARDMILGLMLIPLGLCFFFIYMANTFTEEQEAIKWFFRVLSLIMIVVVFAGANTAIATNTEFNGFTGLYNIGWVQSLIFTFIAIVIILFIAGIFMSFQEKKRKDFENGFIK